MRKLIAGLFLILLLCACDNTETQQVLINDKTINVEKRSFTIACDIDKHLGIAYFIYGAGDGRSSPSGILTDEDYDKFCGEIK